MTVDFREQYAEHERRRTVHRSLLQPAAALSVGAALVHALAARYHLDAEPLVGVGMIAAGVLQLGWPLLVWRVGRAALVPGAVLHAGVALLWVTAVTVGLPGLDPDAVGPLGVGATLMEGLVVLLVGAALRPGGRLRPLGTAMASPRLRELSVPLAAGLCVTVLTVAAGGGHGH